MHVVPFMRTMTATDHKTICGEVRLLAAISLCFLGGLSVGSGMPSGASLSAQEPLAKGESESSDRESKAVVNEDRDTELREPIDLKSDVLEWVDELDASSLRSRREAEKSLIEAGPAALPYLPESIQGASVEASERLTRIRESLQAMRTEKEVETAAVPIRLDKVSTLGEALEAISRVSGVEFEHNADESMPVTPIAAPLSFWHAVDLVLDQTNLDINFYGGDVETLQLISRAPERPSRVDSAAYTGVYRMEPTSVTSRRSLRQPSMSGLNVSVEISWEPRFTPIGLTLPITQLTGRLDDDAILKPQESGETIDVATNSGIAFSEFFLPFELPAGQPGKIKSLSGVIRALLPGKMQTFELPLIEQNSKKTIDAMTVEVEALRPNGPLYEIRLGVELQNAGRSLESHRHWIFENDVFVRRQDGSRADHLGFEVYRQSESGVGVGYLFDLGDAVNEATLIYESPTAVVPNEVSFVLQDVALP